MNHPNLSSDIFISQFTEFENNDNIDLMISRAVNYFEKYTCFCDLDKQYAVFLLAAHLLNQQNNIANGDTTGGVQQSASIDKISVSNAPAPYSDNFDYWLNQSVYGQELLAYLNMKVVTPQYVGGSFIRVL